MCISDGRYFVPTDFIVRRCVLPKQQLHSQHVYKYMYSWTVHSAKCVFCRTALLSLRCQDVTVTDLPTLKLEILKQNAINLSLNEVGFHRRFLGDFLSFEGWSLLVKGSEMHRALAGGD